MQVHAVYYSCWVCACADLQAATPGGDTRTEEDRAETGPPRVRLPIEGCSVKEAALFLRFLYYPEQITPANMGILGPELTGVSHA